MNIPHPFSPFRAVDWRARRCGYLVACGKQPSRCRDDRWTWKGYRFLSSLARCDDDRRRERVRRRWPDLAAAVDLRQSDDALRRWEVEARLLAGESFAAIAEKAALAPGAVEAYGRLYFDVIDALHARYWVVLQAIRYAPSRTYNEQDVETWLKMYAYFYGSHVLDALLSFYRDPEPLPDDVTQVPPDRRSRAALHLRIRAALAARCAPYGDPRVDQSTLLADQLEALARAGDEGADQPAVDLPQVAGEQGKNTGTVEQHAVVRRAS